MKTHSGHIGTLANAGSTLAGGQLVSLAPANDIETNYINFYNVYRHYKDSTFSLADSIMLRSLVEGCPVRDGMAVSYARTLYSLLYMDYTVYNDFCFDEKSAKMATNGIQENIKKTNLTLEVYPNPNNGTFTINLNGEISLTEETEVSIYNILGNKINSFNLQFVNNIANFKTELGNGIYFILVKNMQGNFYPSTRFIVIK